MNDHLQFKDKVVARLRNSKAEFEEREKTDKREAARKWACETAEYGDLLRVATALDRVEHRGGAVGVAVTEAILSHSFSQWEFHKLWGKTGNEDPTETYIRAFANGALELWREVAAEVEPSPGKPAGDEAPDSKARHDDIDRWHAIEVAAYALAHEPEKEASAIAGALEHFPPVISEGDLPGYAVRHLLCACWATAAAMAHQRTPTSQPRSSSDVTRQRAMLYGRGSPSPSASGKS